AGRETGPCSRAGPSRSSARSTARASPSTGARTSWSTRAGSARTRSSPVSWPRSGEPMPSAFSQRLDAGPLLCDGAMGTMLYARGVSLDACFDVLNLNNPRLVQAIHAEYVAAGADLIETNTFGANRFKLAAHGLESQVREVNRRGVRLARDLRESTGRELLRGLEHLVRSARADGAGGREPAARDPTERGAPQPRRRAAHLPLVAGVYGGVRRAHGGGGGPHRRGLLWYDAAAHRGDAR